MSLSEELRDFLDMNENGTDEEVQRGIFLLAVLGCKHLLSDSERDHAIDVIDADLHIDPNIFYECMREIYSRLDDNVYKQILSDKNQKPLVGASQSIACSPGIKAASSHKYKSKHTTMIWDEIRSLYRDNRFRTKDENLRRALTAFEVAYRELFIRLRRILNEEQYDSLPVDLSIDFGRGSILVRSLFTKSQRDNHYRINVKLSNSNSRKLQLLIGKYMVRCMR